MPNSPHGDPRETRDPSLSTNPAPMHSTQNIRQIFPLYAAFDLEETFRVTLDALDRVTGCDKSAVFALDPAAESVSLHTAHGFDEAFARAAQSLPLALPETRAALNGEVIRGKAQPQPPRHPEWIELAKRGEFQSLVDLPLVAGEGIFGSLVLFFNRPHILDDLERDVLKAAAYQIATVFYIIQHRDALQRERNLIQTVSDCMSEGVVVVDNHNRIATANPAAHEMLGAEPGQPWSCRPIFNDLTRRASTLLAAHRSHPPDLGSPIILEKEGRLLSIRSTPVTDGGQDPPHIVYFIRDITHWVELDQIKSDFIGQVSHELRTPLTTIKTLVGVLKKKDFPDEGRREYLNVIETEVDRQTRLVNDLLEIGRLETADFNWTMVEVSLTDVAHRAMRSCQPLAAEKNIRLTGLPLPSLPRVMGTPRRLQEVLTNLLTNAIKYTPAGGRVSVEAGNDEKAVWIAVRDTGPGIPEADLPYLFDKFYRARQNKLDGQGLGLGLSIAQQIVKALRGSIKVESEVGRGSCFTVHLPRARAFVTAMREDLRRVRNGSPNPADR